MPGRIQVSGSAAASTLPDIGTAGLA